MKTESCCPNCGREGWTGTACPHCGSGPSEKSSPSRLPAGTVLNDRYRIGAVLGQGGFGITYLGWDKSLDLRLAVKEFFPLGLAARVPGGIDVVPPSGEEREAYEEGLVRFLEEARILARFDGISGIVSVRDSFQANGTAYMVMNCLEGVTLKEYLQGRGGHIPFEEAMEILSPIMTALGNVHRAGWLHRDVTPDNIIIPKSGTPSLLDFGAARSALRGRSRSISVILKPGYAPEEQYRSRGEQGPWTDVYGICATLYRCVTGEAPPDALDRLHNDTLTPPSQKGADISGRIEAAIRKGLAISAKDRYQTMEDTLHALMRGERTPHQDSVAARRRRLHIWLGLRRWIALAVVLLAGVATAIFMRGDSMPQLVSQIEQKVAENGTNDPQNDEYMEEPYAESMDNYEIAPSPTSEPQPQHQAKNLLNEASDLIEAGKFDAAAAKLKEAIAENPQDVVPRIVLARLYIAKDKFAEARDEAQDALEIAPLDTRVLFVAASAAEGLGKKDEAMRYAKTLLAKDATYPGAQALLDRVTD